MGGTPATNKQLPKPAKFVEQTNNCENQQTNNYENQQTNNYENQQTNNDENQ